MKILTQPQRDGNVAMAATIGMFDGMHLGHRCLLDSLKSEAKRRGLATAVVTFRDHPQNVLYGGNLKWICTLDDRIRCLEAQGVDYLILMDFTKQLASLDSKQYMEMLRDDYGVQALVVGFNHHFGHNRKDGFDCYCKQGSEIDVDVVKATEYAGELAPVSSSIIREMIAEGDVESAAKRLCHPFCISGTVVHGKKNGRKMGFPTANVGEYSTQIVMPPRGVYAALASVDGGACLPAMANVGVRPTLHDGDALSVEVNILDFDEDIYGKPFTVYLLKHLREERQFSSLDALKHQLTADRDIAREYIKNQNI